MKNIPLIAFGHLLWFPISFTKTYFFVEIFVGNFTIKIPIKPELLNHPNPPIPSPQYTKINLGAKYPFWIGVKLSIFGVKWSKSRGKSVIFDLG